MDAETAKVTITMTMPEFERVFSVLQSYKEFNTQPSVVKSNREDLSAADAAWIEDTCDTISNLNIRFTAAPSTQGETPQP